MHRCGHPKANAHALSTRHPHTSWPPFRDSSLSEEQIKGEGWAVCSNGLRANRVGNYCTRRTGVRTHIPLILHVSHPCSGPGSAWWPKRQQPDIQHVPKRTRRYFPGSISSQPSFYFKGEHNWSIVKLKNLSMAKKLTKDISGVKSWSVWLPIFFLHITCFSLDMT